MSVTSSLPNTESRLVTFRNAFISGALLLAPLIVTVWAFAQIIALVGGTVRPLFFDRLPATLRDLPFLWDVVSTISVVLIVTALGYVSRYVFGKFFVSIGERFMLSIPGVSAVYNTVKQIVDTFGTQNKNLFNQVVLVEFPRPGIWAIGFLTNKTQGEAQAKTAEEVWTVFVPTTPNPTSGFLMLFPTRDITPLEMSVGEGMKMIISGGAVVPPWPAVKAADLAK
ncbi:MAG: hypothetical protein B9S26_03805 [Opitutia bacterium Tous-C4FEB]|nr:MAG: hypothetical protein B9S35_01490 [Opitutae bacterium Tous-C5TDCM]PAW90570.1 MAG: hypothetical protein B9S26_03805 [Opitutae bacterium Tous-C4FEB]